MDEKLQKELERIDEYFSNLSDKEFEKILDDAMPKTKDNKGSLWTLIFILISLLNNEIKYQYYTI